MKRLVAAAALAAVALTGCSDPIASGTVVRKVYDDPDTWTYWQSTYCPYFSTINGVMYTFYNTCGGYYVTDHDGPHWELRLKDDKDPKHHGWVEVTQEDYGKFTVGSHWPDPR